MFSHGFYQSTILIETFAKFMVVYGFTGNLETDRKVTETAELWMCTQSQTHGTVSLAGFQEHQM